jgi:hypothetical protein
MTDSIDISATDHGRLRVFAIDAPEAEAKSLAADPQKIALALGLTQAAADGIEAFPLSNIETIGLTGYLTEGYAIDPDDLAAHKAALDSLTGHVALVASRAFAGKPVTLKVAAPLRLVATLEEERQIVSFDDLPSGGAETRTAASGIPAQARPDRSRNRNTWTGIIGVAVIILLFIVIGGVR